MNPAPAGTGLVLFAGLNERLKRLRQWTYTYRPRFREKDFWIVQGLIILIAVLHDYAESLGLLAHLGTLYFLTISLFFVPLIYAALHFGLVGSLATAIWVMIVTIPDWALFHHSLDERLGVILSLLVVNGLTVFVGQRVDREKKARLAAEEAGEALRVSEIKYRNLFESSPVPVLVLTPDGTILETNPAAELLFGSDTVNKKDAHLSHLIGTENTEQILGHSTRDKDLPEAISVDLKDGQSARLKPTLTELNTAQEGTVIQTVLRNITEEYNRQLGLRAYAASVIRTQEEERQRIARDLHDETIQSLVLLCRRLDNARDSSPPPPSEITEELSEARKTAQVVVQDLREFTTSLRPPALEDLGLITAIRRLVRDLAGRSKIAANMKVAGEEKRLPPDTELGIFRIAQEALWNAERYSGAAKATVTITFGEEDVKLEIKDDGSGFSMPVSATDFTASGHLGILGMQERANLLGGTLELQSTPGSGTVIVASIPDRQDKTEATGIPEK